MSEIRLERRSMPDRLRYLAEQLRKDTHWSAVSIALDAAADDLASTAKVEDLGDATYVYITHPGGASGLCETQIDGRTYRLYINATAAPSTASKDEG